MERFRQETLAQSKTEQSPDERAPATEAQMTDDERFALIISLIGAVPSIGVPRDKRIPEDVKNMSAGYTPGVPRLGVPACEAGGRSPFIGAVRRPEEAVAH